MSSFLHALMKYANLTSFLGSKYELQISHSKSLCFNRFSISKYIFYFQVSKYHQESQRVTNELQAATNPLKFKLCKHAHTTFNSLQMPRFKQAQEKNHFPNLKNPVQTKDQVKKQSGPPCLLEGQDFFFCAEIAMIHHIYASGRHVCLSRKSKSISTQHLSSNVVYICSSSWLLADKLSDLSQAEKKIIVARAELINILHTVILEYFNIKE